MSQTQLRIKIFPYKIEPKDSVNLDAIINIIVENEDLIEYNYNNKDDLICLQKELSIKLIHFVNKIDNEEINKKELLKYSVREAFELNEKDIVIIKNNQIFIKLLNDDTMREVKEEEKETIAGRYNGIKEDELLSFYNNFFLKEENSEFFNIVAEQFVEIYMLEKRIDNFAYEKYVFSIIHTIITEQLTNSFDKNDNFFKGFSGYIFRMHFKEVFGYIANLILSEMISSNSYIIDFLKYYSLNIVVVEGQKYKVPEIEAENGLKWNVVSMTSVVKVYIKTKMSLDFIKDSKYQLIQSLNSLLINTVSPIEYNNNINKEIDKISQDLVHITKKLNIYTDSLNSLKNDTDKAVLRKNVEDVKKEILILKNEKNKLTSKIIKKEIINKYNDIKKEIDSLIRQEKRDERVLEQNRESYTSIKNSLVKALTSKKTLIEEINA
ncbi:MAG: hypothetical protein A2513_03505 [Sulfurimonas sp. RIFOXYD12_FULL_33_39]|nr:MAG: hypothetical protein A3G74_03945 [Sulfurimonas sp. RIFCSPLOWO2_12_FULL_34_6]OHE09535.1 MAG: hypothetical protein A2513_03505 [Sulfurimonas sp. RIFOXYD12_FULL_33_39]OHE13050.1 MAG: hypothetical protein A2530_05300 [Sulfurimonas sp. RIFOXYD2_FULL_34_21]